MLNSRKVLDMNFICSQHWLPRKPTLVHPDVSLQSQTVCPPPLWEALQGPPFPDQQVQEQLIPAAVTLLNHGGADFICIFHIRTSIHYFKKVAEMRKTCPHNHRVDLPVLLGDPETDTATLW
ncbi:unnamed protein product [Pleuronectes platessa]|uniref:Uncharacterized protein n=1 Tax=Pleuronectes platessa TaxID=8262 RepID=A0A9N7V8G9_PLEPL|nr:unnamed protein product [Pleuronectes platessa]